MDLPPKPESDTDRSPGSGDGAPTPAGTQSNGATGAATPPTDANGRKHPRSRMFESLKFRDFRLLWISNLGANFAMQMQMVARGWLIYAMTESPMALAWVMLSFAVPQFMFSLVGGVAADRFKKKSIMVGAQSLNAIATFVLGWVIITGNVSFWHFIVFGVFNGTVLSFSMPARSSIIPEIVGRDTLVNAMALQSMVFNISRILGPMLAGILIAYFADGDKTSSFGVGVIYFAISGMYLGSVFCTSLIHYVGAPMEQRRGTTPLQDAAEGLQYLKREHLIQGLLVMGFLPMTFGFTASSLLPAFNHDVVHGGADELGFLMTAMGGGALCSSLLLARLGDISRKGKTMFVTGYLWAVVLFGFAISSQMIPAMVMAALIGLCSSLFGNLNGTVVQLAVSPEIRGRVMSIMMMTFGLMPLGVLPVSAAAEYFGIGYALVGAAIMLAVSMLVLDWLYPQLRRIDKGHGDDIYVQARSAPPRQ